MWSAYCSLPFSLLSIWPIQWSILGSYQTIWSSPFTNAKLHSVSLPNIMTTLHRSLISTITVYYFIQIRDLFTELDLYRIMRGFHRAFATGVACMPTGDSYSSEHLIPSHLVLAYVLLVETCRYFFRTMLFEHPSVLSRVCFVDPGFSTFSFSLYTFPFIQLCSPCVFLLITRLLRFMDRLCARKPV